MRKRIAAAALAAFVNLLGSANADALLSGADDDDSPDGVDCVEFRPTEHAAHQTGGVLAAAAAAWGEPVDGAWVARTATGARAAVTVQHETPHIAFIDVTAVATITADFTLAGLLGHALTFCVDHGMLKVVVQTDGLPGGTICRFVESRGFQFSRRRVVDGMDHLEFYRDLYRRSPHET